MVNAKVPLTINTDSVRQAITAINGNVKKSMTAEEQQSIAQVIQLLEEAIARADERAKKHFVRTAKRN